MSGSHFGAGFGGGSHFGVGQLLSGTSLSSNPLGQPPSYFNLSEVSITDDLSVGSRVATISGNGDAPVTYSITSDPDNKFVMAANGTDILLSSAVDGAVAAFHDLQIRAENAAGFCGSTVRISVEEAAPAHDVVAPTIDASVPVAGTTNLPVNQEFVFSFPEPVQWGGGSAVKLQEDTGGGFADVENFTGASGASAVISGDGLTLTITPTADLTLGAAVNFRFLTDSLQDLAGNPIQLVNYGNFTVAASSSSNSITQTLGITTPVGFPFATAQPNGNYEDGPGYFVAGAGQVTAYEPTPAQTVDAFESKITHGAEINPQMNDQQGYDERMMHWNASRNASFPAVVQAGDVILKAVGRPTVLINSDSLKRQGVPEGYAACYIVAEAPPANSFSPAAVGWPSRGTPEHSVIDVDARLAASPAPLDTSAHTGIPSFESIMSRVGHFTPIFAQTSAAFDWYRQSFPHDTAAGENYGLYINQQMVDPAIMALMSSSFTTAQKRQIAVAMISKGKQWWDAFEGNGSFNPRNGGHFQFHWFKVALFLSWSGQEAELANLFTVMAGNYSQAFEVTADHVSRMVPHSNGTDPYPYRQRRILAVDTGANTITVEVTRTGQQFDPPQISFTGFTLTDGTNTALVISQNKTDWSGSSDSIILTVDDATGFAVSGTEDTYCIAPFTPAVGDAQWGISGVSEFNKFSQSPHAVYRALNAWASHIMGLKFFGIWHPSWNAALRMVEYSMLENTPSATWDYAPHASTPWTQQVWADYWPQLNPPSSDTTAPVLSVPTAAANGSEGATGLSVVTDEDNVTLYWGVYPTSDTPDGPAIIDGTGAVINGNQPVNGTGLQNVPDQAGLNPNTAFRVHYVQLDAVGNRSNVVTSAEFTTEAGPPVVVFSDDFETDTTGNYASVSGGVDTIVAGRLRVTNSDSKTGFVNQRMPDLVVGQQYRLDYTAFVGTASGPYVRLGTGVNNGAYLSSTASGVRSVTFTATSTVCYLTLRAGSATLGQYSEYDDISLSAV